MESAFETLLGQGILGAFLVLVIIYHLRTVRELKTEMKEKSIAHAEQMNLKDQIIEEKNNKIHEIGIEAVTSLNEFTRVIKESLKS